MKSTTARKSPRYAAFKRPLVNFVNSLVAISQKLQYVANANLPVTQVEGEVQGIQPLSTIANPFF